MSELESWWVHTVAVEKKLGSNVYGDKFADPVPLLCFVEDDTKLIRGSDGTEVVSSATLAADLDLADTFTLGSLVTTSSGRESRVLGIERLDSGPLGGLDHIEVQLS